MAELRRELRRFLRNLMLLSISAVVFIVLMNIPSFVGWLRAVLQNAFGSAMGILDEMTPMIALAIVLWVIYRGIRSGSKKKKS